MATTYYFQASNSYTTCDVAPSYDMSLIDATGLVSGSTGSLSFVEVMTFDMDGAGLVDTNTQTVSIPITLTGVSPEFRYRIQQINSSTCAVMNSSSYSATYTTNGLKTDSLALTWTGTSGILRVSLELRRTGGAATPRIVDVTIDSTSYISIATPAPPASNVSRRLSIARDCWWMMPSGSAYITNESTQLSTQSRGIFRSIDETLGASDSTYIQNGSTIGGSYYFRVTNDHIVPDILHVKIRAKYGSGGSSDLSLNLYINGVVFTNVATITSGASIQNVDTLVTLNDYQKRAILNGRKNEIYDFCQLEFNGASTTVQYARVYGIELYYENNTYTEYLNHNASRPGAVVFSLFPIVTNNINCNWITDSGVPFTSGDPSILISKYASGVNADVRYIRCIHEPYLVTNSVLPSAGASIANSYSVPSGNLTLYFDVSGILDPNTQLNRANLYLRMSVPPSSTTGNYRDAYEVHGYNYGSGNIMWGGGSLVEQSGFKTYTTELCWLKPDLYSSVPLSGNIAHPYYRTSESIRTLELRVMGIPSGTYLSVAELRVEAQNDLAMNLYTSGSWPNATLNLFTYNAFQSGIKNLYVYGKSPTSGILPLHALGFPAVITSKNLYTVGVAPSSTKNLYINGGYWTNENLPLVTSGRTFPSATKYLNLFTRATTNSGTSNVVNLFVPAYYDPLNTLNLVTSGSDVPQNNRISLYTFSDSYSYSVRSNVNLVAYNINASAAKTINLFLKNTGTPYSGQLPLIMGRANNGIPGAVPLFMKSLSGKPSGYNDMYVYGNVRATGNLNFRISGKHVPVGYQNLYSHGF